MPVKAACYRSRVLVIKYKYEYAREKRKFQSRFLVCGPTGNGMTPSHYQAE